MFSPYQAKYFAYELSRRCPPDSVEKLAGAQVDLNSHQVDAALFAFNSPLSKGALVSISNRLKAKLRKQEPAESLEEELDRDYEALDETAEEWPEDAAEILTATDRQAIEREIADLDAFAQLAASIEHNAKGKALLKALHIAFAKAQEIGAAQKAIIFTESRRTQSYLLRVLADSPYAEGVVLFNGSNTDDGSKLIYGQWLERHQGSDRVATIEGKLAQSVRARNLFAIRWVLV